MYIIDKNKDFYDYVSNIYGVDKNIVYDRRGSEIIDDSLLVLLSGYRENGLKILNPKFFFLLETGNVQYIFEVYNVKFDKSTIPYTATEVSFRIAKIYRENKNLFVRPLTVMGIHFDMNWTRKGVTMDFPSNVVELEKLVKKRYSQYKQIPAILANTKLTSLLDPFEVWKDIQTYISSTGNDKDISTPMTEKQKVESHGFDENSFRNPIKL